jgi:hypothetical protein
MIPQIDKDQVKSFIAIRRWLAYPAAAVRPFRPRASLGSNKTVIAALERRLAGRNFLQADIVAFCEHSTKRQTRISGRTTMGNESLSFIEALHADSPAPDRADKMMLYGRFIGAWDGTVTVHRANGERFDSSAEVHFGWALLGRAIQDVWIVPSRAARAAGEADRMYGTTLRIYDPDQDHWQIIFIDPERQSINQMTGRQVGADIVQEYRDAAGAICQWCFTEIEANAFHWISRESTDQRKTWRLTGEFCLKRR